MRGLAISFRNRVTKRSSCMLYEPLDIANSPLVAYRHNRSIGKLDQIFRVEEVPSSVPSYDLVRSIERR